MLLSIDSGVSALEQDQQSLNVIANNIANVNTVGFKSGSLSFADTLSETLGTTPSGSIQVGTGVMTAGITNNFSAGSITSTGIQTNLAVEGNGFFLVKDPTTGNSYVTQDGEFSEDANGYLITSNGQRLQGYNNAGLTTANGVTTGGTTVGDVQISNINAPNGDTSAVQKYTIGSDGSISVLLADGTQFTAGQILLQNVANPNELVKAGGNLYSGLTAAGATTVPTAPNANGMGSIVSGSLEMSNVDLATQLTNLITVQSAYQASSKVITTSDNVLQTLVNLVR